MSFTNDQTGLERGAVQLLLTVPPRIMDRYQEGGPARAATRGLTGNAILVEYVQTTDDASEVWNMETLTELQASTLRTLLNTPGPLTAKPTRGTTLTFLAAFGPDYVLEPIVGHYTNTAPAAIRYWRATVTLLRL